MQLQFPGLKPKNLTPRQQQLWKTLLFLLRLLVLSLPLYLILSLPGLLLPLQSMVSQNAASILSLSYPIAQEGLMITVQSEPPFPFLISEDCTGWKSMLFLFALLFAVPAVALRKRLWGLVIGIPVLYMANLLRIYLIVSAQQAFGTATADLLHTWLWGTGMALLVLLIWGLWLFRTKAVILHQNRIDESP